MKKDSLCPARMEHGYFLMDEPGLQYFPALGKAVVAVNRWLVPVLVSWAWAPARTPPEGSWTRPERVADVTACCPEAPVATRTSRTAATVSL
jgi:hypothetical protein